MSRITRVLACFWGFGLINNLLYVVILSAAVDLVGSSLPKGLVLLADVLPSFIFKFSAPFYFHAVPYSYRVGLMVFLSFLGVQLIAHGSRLPLKLFGIALASLSSGMGEVTFLQLTHYFKENAINAWSSGTGAAGLMGSFIFMVMTTWAQLSTKSTLIVFSFIPFLMSWLYFKILPHSSELSAAVRNPSIESIPIFEYNRAPEEDKIPSKLQRIRKLLLPFILPLMTVYVAEYVINQGVSPTLLYDLKDMPMFHHYRDAYVMYNTLYQIGVFISRSSATVFRIRKLWLAAILQVVNVLLSILQSMYMFNSSIYVTFVFMIYEGLLGGAAYVNTFMSVSEQMSDNEREFAMGAVTMSDSSGVVLAALVSMWLEPSLCAYQVRNGRNWCQL